ncbi:MAG: hypothetical protein IT366_24475 [Candidatus Hydrogenedentes bacterium]|nr:hypothetical protein [Candidatus Hydrogenedentota bacterium]
MPKTKSHGGKRQGAGRPRIGEEPSRKHSVTLPGEWWDYAQSLDVEQGSISAGIREALKFHAEQHPKRKRAKTG